MKADLQADYDVRLSHAKKQREDQIARLKEALKIAQNLGLDEPPKDRANYLLAISDKAIDELAYMRGSKALQAELQALQTRQNDAAFIPALMDITLKLDKLNAIKLNNQILQTYYLSSPIAEPVRPVKPKKALIVILGLLLGGIIGVLFALIRGFAFKRKDPKWLEKDRQTP